MTVLEFSGWFDQALMALAICLKQKRMSHARNKLETEEDKPRGAAETTC